MKFRNKYCKKAKNTYPLLVKCTKCKNDLFLYQKGGKGNLIKMKVDKIISSQSNIRELPSRINCPYCNAPIANLAQYKGENYYWIIRGRVMVRKIDKKI